MHQVRTATNSNRRQEITKSFSGEADDKYRDTEAAEDAIFVEEISVAVANTGTRLFTKIRVDSQSKCGEATHREVS